MSLEYINISHKYGSKPAVSDIMLSAARGEITCLLGPSGCGKTTLLRLAAGLLDVQEGEILLDGAPLAKKGHNPPPEARNVGLVFQEGALFPHMSVADNIGFGLSLKDPKSERPHKQNLQGRADKAVIINDILAQLGLAGYAQHYPNNLSGGQKQRVALGRAIAPQPDVLLLDEPFANVDVVRRRVLREETRRVLKDRGAVAILVTHDPEEALEVADRIAVMENGLMAQAGAPHEVYDAPISANVAALFGDGIKITGTRNGEAIETAFGLWPLSSFNQPVPDAAHLDLIVRPEALDLAPGDTYAVEDARVSGAGQKVLVIAPNGEKIWASAPRSHNLARGDKTALAPKKGGIFAFAQS